MFMVTFSLVDWIVVVKHWGKFLLKFFDFIMPVITASLRDTVLSPPLRCVIGPTNWHWSQPQLSVEASP
jgi:hypothetical protein